MDWSRIKTIFIVTFLLLDVYLIYEFVKLRDLNQFEIPENPTFENQLKAAEIEYVKMPSGPKHGQYLSATPKKFTNDDLTEEQNGKFKNQNVSISNETTLVSFFEEPIELNNPIDLQQFTAFIQANILYGNQYRLWEVNQGEITLYQVYNDKPFFNNANGKLTFYLNTDQEIVSYHQTYLEEIEEMTEEDDTLIQPMKALESVYNNGDLLPQSKITSVEPGYYTFVQYSTTSQVLTPAWRFLINDEKNVYVNAFDSKVVQLSEEEKIIVE
ncbi:two-component system regulatory protein YycI [Bacillaceae bacterium Marseille-Q3522]|nr:two-component system regulatory protein YycI [Bacillaceae bacterium Marseille-Q3522]